MDGKISTAARDDEDDRYINSPQWSRPSIFVRNALPEMLYHLTGKSAVDAEARIEDITDDAMRASLLEVCWQIIHTNRFMRIRWSTHESGVLSFSQDSDRQIKLLSLPGAHTKSVLSGRGRSGCSQPAASAAGSGQRSRSGQRGRSGRRGGAFK